MAPTAAPDIDRILEAIRSEARARGSKGVVGAYSAELGGAAVHVAIHGLAPPEVKHAADLLALPLDVFIASAYRSILGREPDAGGASHYQRALLRGRLTRVEVMGRLAYASEGRHRGGRLPGLLPAFLLATAYRIPLAGPLLALAARALCLPLHWQDRSRIEAVALATGAWMKR